MSRPCACGHRADEHVTTDLSVHIGTEPGSKEAQEAVADHGYFAGIHHRPHDASYSFGVCHCGCTIYTEDHGAA